MTDIGEKKMSKACTEITRFEQAIAISAKELAKVLSLSPDTIWRLLAAGKLPKTVSIGASKKLLKSDIHLFLACNCNMAGFQAQKQSQFEDVQELLGTLLLALNWSGWSREDRAILLFWIDALERRLIDIKRELR